MDFEFIFRDTKNGTAALLADRTGRLADVDDTIDLMGNASFSGADRLILFSDQLPDSFTELRTGVAGEILQKFSNYRMKLAIIGDFTENGSKALRDFIRESNRTGHILFVGTMEEAIEQL
ncbi:MAG: DUF4180 domain-containing protein [Bacteroidota bacterium]